MKKVLPNTFDQSQAGALDARMRTLIERRQDLLGSGYSLFYSRPLEIVRGEGVYLYDRDGARYLDGYNNVPAVGHCNPRVLAAIERQSRLLNTNTRYAAEPILDYAERLLATHVDELARVMFTCTGSEANDLALRIARTATGADGVVVTANAYHGTTLTVAEISPNLGLPLPGNVRVIAAPAAGPAAEVGETFAADLSRAIADLEASGGHLAAFVADSIFASDGLRADPPGFLAPALDVVRRAGGLYVADEVQPGFGRVGERMWGYRRHDIAPDLVTLGKPMGNGLPIAGVVGRAELIDGFGDSVRYFNTFGGNSLSIAAAAAVLEEIESRDLAAHAEAVGGHLLTELRGIAASDPHLGEVRGAGLFIAVDLVDPDDGAPSSAVTQAVVNEMKERNVLISSVGPTGSTLKIRPPLPFAMEDAEFLLTRFGEVLETLPEASAGGGR